MSIYDLASRYVASAPTPSTFELSRPDTRWLLLNTKYTTAKALLSGVDRSGYSADAAKQAQAKLRAEAERKSGSWLPYGVRDIVSPDKALETTNVALRDFVLYNFDTAEAGLWAHEPSIVAKTLSAGIERDDDLKADMLLRYRTFDALIAMSNSGALNGLPRTSAASGLGAAVPVGVIVGVAIVAVLAILIAAFFIAQTIQAENNNRARLAGIKAACSSGDSPACRYAIDRLQQVTAETAADKWLGTVKTYGLWIVGGYIVYNLIVARESARFARWFK